MKKEIDRISMAPGGYIAHLQYIGQTPEEKSKPAMVAGRRFQTLNGYAYDGVSYNELKKRLKSEHDIEIPDRKYFGIRGDNLYLKEIPPSMADNKSLVLSYISPCRRLSTRDSEFFAYSNLSSRLQKDIEVATAFAKHYCLTNEDAKLMSMHFTGNKELLSALYENHCSIAYKWELEKAETIDVASTIINNMRDKDFAAKEVEKHPELKGRLLNELLPEPANTPKTLQGLLAGAKEQKASMKSDHEKPVSKDKGQEL